MERKIIDHFREADPIIYAVIIKLPNDRDRLGPNVSDDYFHDLCETIINQQLSDKAAATIFGRLVEALPGQRLNPRNIAKTPEAVLRGVGMSGSKVRYIKSLAQSFQSDTIDFRMLKRSPDETVIEELMKLKGIGRWSAEMFLMFCLGRENVFSHTDAGLRRAIQKLYGFKKEPTVRQVENIVKKWAPYKTYACRVLWRILKSP